MFLSVNLQGLEQLAELPDREAVVAERLENALRQLHQDASVSQPQNIELIRRQLGFAREELQRIRNRKRLLVEAHEMLSDAKFSFGEKLTEAKQQLQN